MKITINRIVTDWEFERMNVPKEYTYSQMKGEMMMSALQKMQEMPGLFTENNSVIGTEYRFECIILSMESFQNILKLCRQYNIPRDETEKVFNTLMNEV